MRAAPLRRRRDEVVEIGALDLERAVGDGDGVEHPMTAHGPERPTPP